jgi:hypothetical protein
MKTMLKQISQSRLEARGGVLCVVVETPFDPEQSGAVSPAMRQWFRLEEPEADPALVAGRPVRNIDPKEGLFIDDEGHSYRLAGAATLTRSTRRLFRSKVDRVRGWRRALGRCRSNRAAGTVTDCRDGDAAKERTGTEPLRTIRFQRRAPKG